MFFQAKGVSVVQAAALAQGLLTTGPIPWHFATDELKEKTKAVELAQEKGKSIEEVSLH